MKFLKTTKKQRLALSLLFQTGYSEYLFDGGSRAGKTFLIILYCLIICGKYAGIRCLLARFAFAHAKSSIWLQTLLPLLQDNDLGMKYTINHSDHIVKYENGSEIWLGGLDNKERADKILGQEYAFVFLNEAVSFPEKIRDIVKSRLAQRIDGYQNKIVYDCNPRSPLHYLFKEFYIQKDTSRCKLKWLPDDNKENIADNYITGVLDKFTGNEYKRFRLGEWANVEGAVYSNILDTHFCDCPKDFGRYDDIVGGQDWGYYSATNIWGIKENKVSCIYEIILINKTTKDIIKELDEIDKVLYLKQQQYPIYCDHELDRIQEFCAAGYNAIKAEKEVGAGDSTVNNFEVWFDRNCISTFQSMLNLSRQQDNAGNYIDKHVKENDHECLIGDTLIFTSVGYKKIEDIKIGDLVLTRKGFFPVYHKKMTGIKPVYEYQKKGYKLISTDNHKIYVGRSKYKKISLTRQDICCIMTDKELSLCSQLYLMESNILNMKMNDIIKQMVNIAKLEKDICTGRYGNFIMVKYLMGMRYIIKTKMLSIMKYLISNVLTQNFMGSIIKQNIIKSMKSKLNHILVRQERKQYYGIKVLLEKYGIKNIIKKIQLLLSILILYVSNVKVNLKALKINQDSVQINVNQRIGVYQRLIIFLKNVKNVIMIMNRINITKIYSVQKDALQNINGEFKGNQKVYSISIEDCHEYFANNILVRNSDAARYALHSWKMVNQSGQGYVLGRLF
jgi:phage terminase large subunit